MSGHLVAAKLLAATGREDDQLDVSRFTREAEVLGALSHPGIVRYITHGIEDGQRYLVMEWIEGENLATKISHDGLTLREVVTVGWQVAEALAEAHRHGAIHRDVKPENVMLDGGALERARVVDFGLARFVDDDHKLTRTGMAMGTPGYMSPEQARGSRELDGRADVFALGCVLYECIAGFAPFNGENVMALQIKVLMVEPTPLAKVRADVPASVSQVVERMLAKDLDARPPMEMVARDLATLVNVPDGERRIVGTAPPSTQKIGAIERAPSPWLVMAAPKKQKPDWVARVRGAAAKWPHELTRDNALVVKHGGAVEAALCGLELSRALPEATLVVAAPSPSLDETIDRTTRVMDIAALRSIFAKGAATGVIYLDPTTARVLSPSFDVVADDKDAYVLRGQRS